MRFDWGRAIFIGLELGNMIADAISAQRKEKRQKEAEEKLKNVQSADTKQNQAPSQKR